MKLILREHVDHLGERGELVRVAAGYARNYLIPKGLAWEATPGAMKQLEHQRKVWSAKDAKEISEAEALAGKIAALELTVSHKAGESGTLYGSVTNAEVSALLAGKGVEIDRRRLVIDEPIKAIGDYEIPVRIHPKVTARVKLRVTPESTE